MPAGQRSYTDEDRAAALLALDMNQGFVDPTAKQLDMPRPTLNHWSKRADPVVERAKANITEQRNVQTLAETFLRLAQAAADHALEALPKANAYHAALIGAISLDKWAILSGRPTSRTEHVSIRYVAPTALRQLARQVLDVEARTESGTSAPVAIGSRAKDVAD